MDLTPKQSNYYDSEHHFLPCMQTVDLWITSVNTMSLDLRRWQEIPDNLADYEHMHSRFIRTNDRDKMSYEPFYLAKWWRVVLLFLVDTHERINVKMLFFRYIIVGVQLHCYRYCQSEIYHRFKNNAFLKNWQSKRYHRKVKSIYLTK